LEHSLVPDIGFSFLMTAVVLAVRQLPWIRAGAAFKLPSAVRRLCMATRLWTTTAGWRTGPRRRRRLGSRGTGVYEGDARPVAGARGN